MNPQTAETIRWTGLRHYIVGAALVLSPSAALAQALDIPKELGAGINARALLEDNGEQARKNPGAQGQPVRTEKTGLQDADKPRGVVVRLKSGGSLEGLLVSDDGKRITLEVGAGTIGLERSMVASIEYKRNALEEFKEREAKVDSSDAKGLWALALWAKSKDLGGYARQTARRVIAMDPDHAPARAFLGYEQVEGRWLEFEQAQKARGLVKYEGRWISWEERQEILSKREELARVREEAARRRREEARENSRLEAEQAALRREQERIVIIRPGIARRRYVAHVHFAGCGCPGWSYPHYYGYPYGRVIITPGQRHCPPQSQPHWDGGWRHGGHYQGGHHNGGLQRGGCPK